MVSRSGGPAVLRLQSCQRERTSSVLRSDSVSACPLVGLPGLLSLLLDYTCDVDHVFEQPPPEAKSEHDERLRTCGIDVRTFAADDAVLQPALVAVDVALLLPESVSRLAVAFNRMLRSDCAKGFSFAEYPGPQPHLTLQMLYCQRSQLAQLCNAVSSAADEFWASESSAASASADAKAADGMVVCPKVSSFTNRGDGTIVPSFSVTVSEQLTRLYELVKRTVKPFAVGQGYDSSAFFRESDCAVHEWCLSPWYRYACRAPWRVRCRQQCFVRCGLRCQVVLPAHHAGLLLSTRLSCTF